MPEERRVVPMELVRNWFHRHFSDPQVVALALVLAVGSAVVLFAGEMLAPVLASLVIAYLLEGPVAFLERRHVPRLAAVTVVFVLFMTALVLVFFGLIPLLSKQATQLFQAFPQMIARGQEILLNLPKQYPALFSEDQVNELIFALRSELASFGQRLLTQSLASVLGVITLAVYLILVPLMVFFFLKDKQQILAWFSRFVPRSRRLTTRVWHDVDVQAANYVRGKCLEILVVWVATYVTFALMGLQFAMLLSVLVGLSVLVPYVGAVAVTFPVAITAFWQWGATPEFAYLLIAYLVIQGLDGNVLVPLLFSEVVNLHPVAIIVAVLIFGGIWGFWGVFFAIPLATLVQAVINAWPDTEDQVPGESTQDGADASG